MFNNYWLPQFKNGHFTGRAIPLPCLAASSLSRDSRWKQSKNFLPIFISPSPSSYLSISELEISSAPSAPASTSTSKSSILLKLSGRLNGVSKARSLSWRYGVLKPQTITSKIGFYHRPIYTKWGTLGLSIIISI